MNIYILPINVLMEFLNSSKSLMSCHDFLTCIKAKITKSAPGPNSTKRVIHYNQGLFADFSFDGVKSRTTG